MAEATGRRIAIQAPDLLLFPSADLASKPFPRGNLRCAQCAATDPVSFALLDGRAIARFPLVPGWSAADWARRAVAEQRARDPHSRATARAEAFAASLARGEPVLELS